MDANEYFARGGRARRTPGRRAREACVVVKMRAVWGFETRDDGRGSMVTDDVRAMVRPRREQGIDLIAGGRNKKTSRTAPKSDNVYFKALEGAMMSSESPNARGWAMVTARFFLCDTSDVERRK